MNIEEMINRINELNELIDEAEEDKQRLLAMAEKCTAIFSDSEGGKSLLGVNTSEINFQKYTDKSIEQDKLTDELADLRAELEILIRDISNTRYRRILKYHYIDGYSIRQTAKKFSYSYSYFRNKLLPKIIKESA